MPLPGCKMTVLVEPPTAFIKIAGRAAVEGARDFKALVERLHRDGVPQFCLDLSQCLLMDSTFSGVLAGLATKLGPTVGEGGKRFVLVNPNQRVTDLLDSLGVLSLVSVLAGEVPRLAAGPEQEVELGRSSHAEVAACCLDAHRLLMALKPENAPKFRELTRMLEKQVSESASA